MTLYSVLFPALTADSLLFRIMPCFICKFLQARTQVEGGENSGAGGATGTAGGDFPPDPPPVLLKAIFSIPKLCPLNPRGGYRHRAFYMELCLMLHRLR